MIGKRSRQFRLPQMAYQLGNLMKDGYIPQLDGIRFIAVALVIATHTRGSPDWINGHTGVDMFFALSGFLITSLLLKERQRTGYISLAGFYIRRTLRIFPLYYLVIALYGVAVYTVSRGEIPIYNDCLPWLLAYSIELIPAAADEIIFGHAWSLGIEEKYYLAWPLLVIVAWRWKLGLVLALGLVTFLLFPNNLLFRGYLGLLVGSGIAIIVTKRPEIITGVPVQLWVALFVSLWLATAFIEMRQADILVAIGAAPLIAAFALGNDESAISKALNFVAPVGKLAYGMYLLHRLVASSVERVYDRIGIGDWFSLFVLTCVATAMVAWVSFQWIEKPLTAKGREWSRKVSDKRPSTVGEQVAP